MSSEPTSVKLCGIVFHSLGAQWIKAVSLILFHGIVGVFSRPAVEDLRACDGT